MFAKTQTGIIAGQIAKIYGHTVIGIAGSPAKCDFLKTLGYDHALDYKSKTFFKDLVKVTPKYVDLCKSPYPGCEDMLTESL